jgi:hypothetical protein
VDDHPGSVEHATRAGDEGLLEALAGVGLELSARLAPAQAAATGGDRLACGPDGQAGRLRQRRGERVDRWQVAQGGGVRSPGVGRIGQVPIIRTCRRPL